MLELPETTTIAQQITDNLSGCTVTAVFGATYKHKFTFWVGDPDDYPTLLTGRKIVRADGHGAYVDILFDGDVHLALSDGVILRYYAPNAKVPAKYQMLLTLDNGGFLVCTVAMYGFILAFRGILDNPYYQVAIEKNSPLTEMFDESYFNELFDTTLKNSPNASAKAFLATEQRIPGIGNGTLQDILFRAKINPRRKIATISPDEKHALFTTLKETLREMTVLGGRDTERDLYGESGGYRTLLSKNTWKEPCPVCGGVITKEQYLGGTVYYCLNCQPL